MFEIEIQQLISNLGWALIHFLWQGTLITLAYWVITRNINSIHAKYWTGMGLVILALITPVINTVSYSGNSIEAATVTLVDVAIISHQQLNLTSLFLYLVNQSLSFLVLLWGSTVVFLSIRLIRSWMQLAAIRHDCEPSMSKELKHYIKAIAIKLDLPVIPALKVSKKVLVPAAYGIFKPTVLLPLSLMSQIPRDQLEAIIKHELCHLKRNDFIHNIIQLCTDILLFFHPGIRWMNNDIRHVREQCCDQMVLSTGTETITYAKALTNIAEFTNGLKLRHSVHLGINDGMLLTRVKFLLQNKSSQSSLMIFAPLLLLIAFSIILLQPSLNNNNDSSTSGFGKEYSYEQNQLGTQTTNETPKSIVRSHVFYPSFNKPKTNPATTLQNNLIGTGVNYQLIAETTKTIDLIKNESQQDNSVINSYPTVAPNNEQNISENISVEILPSNDNLEIDETSNPTTYSDVNATEASNTDNILSRTENTPNTLSSFDESTSNSIIPKFKRYVAPTYPQQFWINQIEQEVIATFKIRPNGKAYDINFNSQLNNYVAFEQQVERAMKSWRFDTSSLNASTLNRTYQQIFNFALTKELVKNCEMARTGSRLTKSMPCNK